MIKIIDVTVRDGLQSFHKILSAKQRTKIVSLISTLGIKDIEIGSIVSDKIIPQMKNSIKVYQNCYKENQRLNYYMLISNNYGISEAMKNNIKHISFFTSPSDTFNLKNINCSTNDSHFKIKEMKNKISNDAYTRGYLSCINECPYEGIIPIDKILSSINFLDEIKIDEIAISDTIGTLKKDNFEEILKNLDKNLIKKLSIHLHQTDDSWKNIIDLCLKFGIYRFDTSLLNLGGCPAAFSGNKKSGNLNLLDLVNYLDEININHNINKNKIIEVENEISQILNLN